MAVGVYVGNNRNGIDASNYPYDANSYMTHKNGLVYHDGSTYSYQSAYGTMVILLALQLIVKIERLGKREW